MMNNIFEIFFTITESIIFLLIYVFFNNKADFIRKHLQKCIIFIFIYSFVASWPANYILPSVRSVFLLILAAMLLGFLTKTNILASLTSIGLSAVFLFSTELIFSIIPMLIYRVDLQTLMNSEKLRLPFGIIVKVIQLIFAYLLIRSNIKMKKLNVFKKSSSLYSLLALQASMISIIIFSISTVSNKESNMLFYNIFLSILYIFFLFLIVMDVKERERLQAIQYKFQAQEEYIGNMETIISIIRREKHDFSNHLNTVLAICALNKPEAMLKVENYIRKISNNIKTSYHFFGTGNDFVDGLLAVKSNFAFEHNIHLEVDFDVSLDSLNINDCDLTSIISNIIDNAFDAIISTDHSEGKVVSLTTYEEDSEYYLSVSNNGPMISEKDINKIFDNGYSTKSCNKSDRGFGLYIVKQLVKRNGGTIEVKSTEEETEFLFKFKKGK